VVTRLPRLPNGAKIWAIADSHLSFERPDRDMTRFGDEWIDHPTKLLDGCRAHVSENDVLLIAGDLSWARKRAEVGKDLEFLASLPGTKIVIRGNHDHWWKAKQPIDYPGLLEPPVVFGDNELAVVGTRGWQTERLPSPDHDSKMLARELSLLTKQLNMVADCSTKIVMTHYPAQPYLSTLKTHAVDSVVFGHVHLRSLPEDEIFAVDNVLIEGIRMRCVAGDRLGFIPVQIYPDPDKD
jgi:predicted phosphohydrolase